MLAIIIPTMIATVAFAWWFRRGNTKATYRPDWEYSGAIEMVVWAIPALTIMLLGRDRLDRQPRPRAEQAAQVARSRRSRSRSSRSTGNGCSSTPTRASRRSTSWSFPAGTPVSFRLTSATVWNVFFVPQMGTMIYTMPRMTTRLNLQADRPGVYDGLSAHFSGDGFPGMQFKVQALPPDQFAMWAQGARGQGRRSTATAMPSCRSRAAM